MKIVNVKTGYGYYKDSAGNIVAKAELPKGNHPIKDGFTYTEVATKAELDAVQVYVDPAELQQQQNERKILLKQRKLAIEALKESGELPADYVDPVK